jgi:hypothetical protein
LGNRRETVTIPGRAGGSGSRVVQVVHMRTGSAMPARSQRAGAQARAAAWDHVFAARPAAPPSSSSAQPALPKPPVPVSVRTR